MYKKYFWIILFTVCFLQGIFEAASADQAGTLCWCNTDQYGCWITAEDGGKSYIMFWSEAARKDIMGSLSRPYELVTTNPGFSGRFPLECIAPVSPAIVLSADTSDQESGDDPNQQCQQQYDKCMADCERADCIPEKNCIEKETCKSECSADLAACRNNAK